MNRKVNTFFVGQPRCGTTSLYFYLKDNPNIYLPSQKQLYHFEKDYNEYRKFSGVPKHKLKNYYHYNIEDYLSRYNGVTEEKVIAEITPSYLFSEVAANEIYKYNSEAKIIAIFRSPVTYIESIHKLLFLNKIELIPNIIDAVNASVNRRKEHFEQSIYEKKEIANYYERINYTDQLTRYTKLFKIENIKIIFYEDFKNNNQIVLDELSEFLSIDKITITEKLEVNSSRKSRIGFIMSILNTKIVNIISFAIPTTLRRFLGGLIRKVGTVKSLSTMRLDEKEFLIKEVETEVNRFSSLLLKLGVIATKDELLHKWKLK